MLAIIGGSGLTQLANLDMTHRKVVRTPYGEPSGALTFGTLRGRKVMFLARHGYGHTIPPHEVNYRANIWALHEEGASAIVSVASVGGIRDDLGPGTLVVPHQVIDYTWGRPCTFFEGGDVPVTHVDFTEPYARAVRAMLFDAARARGETLIDRAVYACTQGPRLESAAEVERLARDGADIVGMTGMPEAALARELDFEYATIAVVVNHAAGRGDSVEGIKFAKLEEVLQQSMGRVRTIIEEVAQRA